MSLKFIKIFSLYITFCNNLSYDKYIQILFLYRYSNKLKIDTYSSFSSLILNHIEIKTYQHTIQS